MQVLRCPLLCLLVMMGVVWSRDLHNIMAASNREKRASASEEYFRKEKFTAGDKMLEDFKPSNNSWGLKAVKVVNDPEKKSGGVLRVHYAKNSYSQTKKIDYGAGFYAKPTSPHTAMMLSYDVYFAKNFDFKKGGKLPGLWGGIEKSCSGGRDSEGCFSTRFMWRGNGTGEVYAYIPEENGQEKNFCKRSDVICNKNAGTSLGRGKWTFKRGKWQNIAQYVKLNTPGEANGYIRVFLDGKKVAEIRNVVLRSDTSKGKSLRIDGMYFSTFFGGGSSSWASPVSTYTYFRNFVFSRDAHNPVIIKG